MELKFENINEIQLYENMIINREKELSKLKEEIEKLKKDLNARK